MLRTRPIAWLVLGILATSALVVGADDQSPTTSKPAVHHHVHKKEAPMVLPPLPPGPLKPVPMDQLPAAAPQVTFSGGMLTIVAQNATLGEILKEVQRLTGATIELPPNGAPERVVTQVGPGAPRDVLATLLNGTAFNYVMLGSASDPRAVASVTLTARPSGTGEVQMVASYQPPAPEPTTVPGPHVVPQPFRQQILNRAQQQAEAAAAADDDSADDSDDDKDDDSDQTAPPGPVPPAPPGASVTQPDQANNGNGEPQGPNPNAGPRTPEQILQMMRQGQQITPQNPPQD
jgi:hypothetical protein